ncbi:maestro heat-like repeat-containing protein family member 2A isoform X2 [Gallus gallus]|uniref:maestro heat-like repeat-containing protein family member 2A isoform X2 n=1 Tax=Gallus gallus TaxID=9031 RepID=UPI001AE57718|nr:maestro heat-like repeat-containing protein family member 2A isoform X2 [Gallus gallus]
MGQHVSRAAVQAAPRGKPQRFSPPMAAQATARPQPQPSSSAMEERNPSCPAEAKEKDKLPQEPTAVPPAPPLDASGLPMCAVERYAMDNIEAFLRSTEPQNEEKKMKFLCSIRTICSSAAERNTVQELRIFCRRNELVENIMVLLAEEPRRELSSELRLQAVAAITSLSKVEGALEEKIPLFVVCFRSIFLLPSEQDLDTNLYSKTLRALDEMLHSLVFIHPSASIGEELKDVFQVLLPFTSLQSSTVRQRAVGRIWKLTHSLAHYCQEKPRHSSEQSPSASYDELRLPVLGQLVGCLILCCAFVQEHKTCRCALSALRHLYRFVLWRSRWEGQLDEQGKLEQWEADHEFSLTWTTNTTVILLRFEKYFHSSEKTDLILLALQGMRDCSNYNTQVASTLMAILTVDFNPMPNDVQRIVTAIHRSRKLITEEQALRTIRSSFASLAAANPRAVTLSLLRCSPTCDKDIWELWELALSSVHAVPKMVQALLHQLETVPLGQKTEVGVLHTAAATALHKLLQYLEYGPQVRLVFPELFVVLIIQLVSAGPLAPLEITAITEDPFRPSAPTSAIRMVVETAHSLLLCAEMDNLAFSMDTHNLWARLQGAATWQNGLHSLAKVMLKNCRDQCRPIFRHLQNLLQYHQLQWREVPAMAFYFELWSCQGHHEDDTCPQKIFRKYIRSKQPRSRELALRGLRNLYAGRMQLLLPDALLWLQDMRADIKLQAIHLLQDIVAQHPASIRGVLSQLAVQLLSCFNEDNAEVRWRSMELFALLLEAPGRKRLLLQAERSLLPLFIHMNEDIPNVAQAAQKALIHAAKLLGWQQLQRLASAAEVWMIADCLVRTPTLQPLRTPLAPLQKGGRGAILRVPPPPCSLQLQKRGRDAEQYLKDTVLHLHSPQVPVRDTAVRFLGLLGRKLRNENREKMSDIRKALEGAKEDSEPTMRCLVLQTLLILSVLEDVPPTRPRLRRWFWRTWRE